MCVFRWVFYCEFCRVVEKFRVLIRGKGSKNGGCKFASHQLFKDKVKNRVYDLQGMFTDLQSSKKESQSIEAAVLGEQVHQMLREWKAELDEPSPVNSLQVWFLS